MMPSSRLAQMMLSSPAQISVSPRAIGRRWPMRLSATSSSSRS